MGFFYVGHGSAPSVRAPTIQAIPVFFYHFNEKSELLPEHLSDSVLLRLSIGTTMTQA
jgi:hypothetical protein